MVKFRVFKYLSAYICQEKQNDLLVAYEQHLTLTKIKVFRELIKYNHLQKIKRNYKE